ncbi:RidA family protein [Aestuariibius insulae]|uniref:RidA family protein n=1 Tax=Aestuariibius insulae TaxID=2058287 RepID=UPI00345E65E9
MNVRILSRPIIGAVAAMFAFVSPAAAQKARTGVYPADIVPIAPYSPGLLTDNGFLYVSGQIAYVDGAVPDHAKDGDDDLRDQTTVVMENIRAVLDEAGYDFNDAVRVTVFLADMDDYGAFNEVYGSYWGEGATPPARAAIEASALPGGTSGAPILVEVTMIAYK